MSHQSEETVFEYTHMTLGHLLAAQRELLKGAVHLAAKVEDGDLTPAELRAAMTELVSAVRESTLAMEALARAASAN